MTNPELELGARGEVNIIRSRAKHNKIDSKAVEDRLKLLVEQFGETLILTVANGMCRNKDIPESFRAAVERMNITK